MCTCFLFIFFVCRASSPNDLGVQLKFSLVLSVPRFRRALYILRSSVAAVAISSFEYSTRYNTAMFPTLDVTHMSSPPSSPPNQNPTSQFSRHFSAHHTALLQRQRDGVRPSHQPLFDLPGTSSSSGAPGSTGGGGGSGNASGGRDGETGEIGDLLNGLSGDEGEGGSSRAADESAATDEGGEGEDDEHDNGGSNGQHTATNIDAMFAEFERGDDEDAGGGGRGTDRKSRRLTADKGDFQSLLGSLESPASSSAAALGAAGTPASDSGSMVAEDDATAQEVPAGSWGALDTPEACVHRRGKRRETADASELQNFFQSPTGITPTASPAAVPAAAAETTGAEVGGSPSNGQQQGAAPVEPSGLDAATSSSPLGAGAAAAATPESERSSATALSMMGVFEPASTPGGPSMATSARARDAVAEGETGGAPYLREDGGGATMTPRLDGGVGDGGKDSGRTAGNGSVLGLLDSTPSPGGGLDQSVADGSALRGRSLARFYPGGSDGGSSGLAAKSEVGSPALLFLSFLFFGVSGL